MHHAQLIIGSFKAAYEQLPVDVRQSTEDCRVSHYDLFTIADARDLRYQASLQAFEQRGRTFILHIRGITTEAQQALLKLFEDPQDRVVFYVIAPAADMFLATVRSRFLISYASEVEETEAADPSKFLGLTYAERLAYVQDLATKKDVDQIAELITGLESVAAKTAAPNVMRELCAMATYRFDRGISVKMLLEHIALSFPIIKKMR